MAEKHWLEVISFKGDRSLWNRWVEKIKRERAQGKDVRIWDKLKYWIKKDLGE